MLYDHPKYYEAAFSYRDIERETDFLTQCAERYLAFELGSVLEVGCGHAPHAGAFASRGIKYSGLDINPNMLEYARSKWSHLADRFSLQKADMVSFEPVAQVDLAFVMLGSLYLKTLDEMTTHFESIAAALRPGGLYFLDWCIEFSDPLIHNQGHVFSQLRDGIKINSRFDIRLLDPVEQLYEEIWTVDVDDHGDKHQFQMIEQNRAIFPQEFKLFIKHQTDFEIVGWWQDWNLAKNNFDAQGTIRPFVLLRKR